MRLGSVCVGQNHRGFASLFCRSAILVVQPDAWDRYGECATLCLSSFAGVEQAAKAVETRRAGPPKVFRRAVARSGEAIL